MPTPRAHAILSPSAAARWLTCTPSGRLAEHLKEQFGEKSSKEADEGTRAHALAEIKVRKAVYKADGMTTSKLSHLPKEVRETYTGINAYRFKQLRDAMGDLPKDMEKATDDYCNVVVGKYLDLKEQDPSTQIFLEQKLDISKWVPECFGSSDCIIVSDSGLEVIDYKHGEGVKVDAPGNPQCRLYALGAVAQFAPFYDFETVTSTIIQPRIDNIQSETLGIVALLDWGANTVKPAAQKAWDGSGEFVPGEHCRFCPAKPICAARVSEALKVFKSGLQSAALIPDDQIPGLMKVLSLTKSWIKDFESYVEGQALKGQRIPGFKLVRGRKGRTNWSDDEEVQATMLRAGYAPEQFTETKLKTPAVMKKEMGKAAFEALLGGLTSQGEAKLELVPEDDKRVEYSSADAAFADLVENNTTEKE